MLPSIIFKTPKIMVRTAQEIANAILEQQALTIENEINAIQLELNLAREYKTATKNALLLGNGCVKYGMTSDYDYDKYAEAGENGPDQNTMVKASPFLKSTSMWDTWIDPCARDWYLEDAGYLMFRSLVSMDQAKADPRFDKKQLKKLTATGIMNYLPEYVKDTRDNDLYTREFAELVEVWDREHNKFLVVDREGVIYLKEEWPYKLEGHFPATFIGFNHTPEEFYCMSEPEFLYYHQLELSEKRTQQLNHTRRFNRKYRVPLDMPQDDLDLLINGEDGTCVRSNNEIQPIADAPLSQDIAMEIENIYREVRETSGVSSYERGGTEKAVYSAAAAKIIDAASSIRVEERRDEVAKAIGQGARILYNILRSTVKPDWPAMRFMFNVDITTMQRPDDEGKRQQLIQFGQIAQPFPTFNSNQWLQDVSLAFLRPPNQYVNPPQPPQPSPEQQKAQTEIQVMQMKAQSEMQSNQADLQIKQQLAQLEIQGKQADLQIKMIESQMRMQEKKAQLETTLQKAQIDAGTKLAAAKVDAGAKMAAARGQHAQTSQDMMHADMQHRQEMQHAQQKHDTATKLAKQKQNVQDQVAMQKQATQARLAAKKVKVTTPAPQDDHGPRM